MSEDKEVFVKSHVHESQKYLPIRQRTLSFKSTNYLDDSVEEQDALDDTERLEQIIANQIKQIESFQKDSCVDFSKKRSKQIKVEVIKEGGKKNNNNFDQLEKSPRRKKKVLEEDLNQLSDVYKTQKYQKVLFEKKKSLQDKTQSKIQNYKRNSESRNVFSQQNLDFSNQNEFKQQIKSTKQQDKLKQALKQKQRKCLKAKILKNKKKLNHQKQNSNRISQKKINLLLRRSKSKQYEQILPNMFPDLIDIPSQLFINDFAIQLDDGDSVQNSKVQINKFQQSFQHFQKQKKSIKFKRESNSQKQIPNLNLNSLNKSKNSNSQQTIQKFGSLSDRRNLLQKSHQNFKGLKKRCLTKDKNQVKQKIKQIEILMKKKKEQSSQRIQEFQKNKNKRSFLNLKEQKKIMQQNFESRERKKRFKFAKDQSMSQSSKPTSLVSKEKFSRLRSGLFNKSTATMDKKPRQIVFKKIGTKIINKTQNKSEYNIQKLNTQIMQKKNLKIKKEIEDNYQIVQTKQNFA